MALGDALRFQLRAREGCALLDQAEPDVGAEGQMVAQLLENSPWLEGENASKKY